MSNNTVDNRVRKARKDYIRYGANTKVNKKNKILWSFYRSLKPPRRIDLDDWMDKYFFLPSETSSEHGRWRTDRFPFLRKLAKKLSPSSRCKEVGACKGAQIGFTTLGLGWNFYISKICPAPSMYVQPTNDAVEEYAEQKFNPSVKMCKAVADTFGEDKPSIFTNKKLRRYYPGGFLALASANSGPQMRAKAICNLQIDEEDGCSQNVNNEGSSVYLAIRRTSNFPKRKIFRLSTPIHLSTSSIIPFCKSGTAERYLVPCPHCNKEASKYGTYFEIKWDNIKYVNDNPSTAALLCQECGTLIEEHYKTWMLKNGMWYRYNPTPKTEHYNDEYRLELLVLLEKSGYTALEKDSIDYLEKTSIPDANEEVCTYFISSLYSPLGFFSWSDAVRSWIEANKRSDKLLLRTFINTVLGEGFAEETEEGIDTDDLSKRREMYSQDGSFDLPEGVLFVTCGVDIQGDRIEAQVIGTGMEDEEWVIDYRVFYGDTEFIGDSQFMYRGAKTSWGQLYEFLDTKYIHETGLEIPIEFTLVDAGFRSNTVYSFVKGAQNKNVHAVRGRFGWGQGFISAPLKTNKYGVRVFDAFVDELKEKTYEQVKNRIPGPNHTHFPRGVQLPKNYFKGLVIEQLKTKQQGVKLVRYWECPNGGRNEPLDTYVYAKTALLAMRPSFRARLEMIQKKDIRVLTRKRGVIHEGIPQH